MVPPPMLLLIDNYDSFTWNLVHALGDVGAHCHVVRNDQLSVQDALDGDYEAIVLSPGPCDPDRAGICLPLIQAAQGRLPILGVCLGHQAIGQAFGGRVIRAPVPMHGKTSTIHHQGQDLLEGVPNPFTATRYHSLVVERSTLPGSLLPLAELDDPSGEPIVMALRHRTLPIWGVQFHPESIASEGGHRILANFLDLARRRNRVPSLPDDQARLMTHPA